MTSDSRKPGPRWILASQGIALFCVGAGLIVLYGWLAGALRVPEEMKAGSALGFLAAGIALWLRSGMKSSLPRKRIGQAAAAVVTLSALATMLIYAFGQAGSDGRLLELLLLNEPTQADGFPDLARIAPATALCFMLLGMALMRDHDNDRGGQTVGWLATGAAVIAFIAVLAHLYDADFSSRLVFGAHMSVLSALLIILLSGGILCLRPDLGLAGLLMRRDAGGKLARIMLPVALLLPPLLGALKLETDHLGITDPRFSLMVVAICYVLIISLLIIWSARSLGAADADRQQAERALAKENDKSRMLLQAATDGIHILNMGGRLLQASDSFYRMLDYMPDEMVGMHVSQWDANFSLGQISEYIDKIDASGGYLLATKHRRRDGRLIDVEVSATSVDIGGTRMIYASARDITERKRAENALQESERKYRRLFNRMAEGFALHEIICDASGQPVDYRFLEVNPAFEKLTGLPAQAVVGRTLLELMPDTEPAWVETFGKVALTGEPAQFEDYSRALGKYFEVTAFRPARRQFACIFTDITERRRSEEVMRMSEQRYSTLFNDAMDGIMLLDTEGRVIDVNESFAQMHGYSVDEMRAMSLRELDTPETLAHASERVALIMQGEHLRFEVEHFHKNGRIVEQEVSARKIDIGAEPYVLAFHRDITERKLRDEEIRQLNIDLEQRINERTRELQVVNRELEAFSYSVSHDLRAPLRGIDGWSLALLEEYGERLDEAGQKYLERVRTETQHMGQLIEDLLQLSRISRAETVVKEVDLAAIAHSVVGRLQELQPERPMEFRIGSRLVAQGDPGLLEILLTNLLDNAIKFTRSRPLAKIEVGRTDAVEPESGAKRKAFFVRDNGVGFDMAYAQKLFGAFQRMHKAKEFPGTGVGLAIVQRIVHRSGGKIWAFAEVDRGATFYFTLGTAE